MFELQLWMGYRKLVMDYHKTSLKHTRKTNCHFISITKCFAILTNQHQKYLTIVVYDIKNSRTQQEVALNFKVGLNIIMNQGTSKHEPLFPSSLLVY